MSREVVSCFVMKILTDMNILELSEQEIVRRNSLNELRKMGIEPYPAAEFVVTGHTKEIRKISATKPSRDK